MSELVVKDFQNWCEEKGLELPELIREVPSVEGKTKDESRSHTGCKIGLYPKNYYAGQYPDAYVRPVAADVVTYQDIDKKKPSKEISKPY